MTAVGTVAGTAAEGAAGIAGDTADECCENGCLTASLLDNSPAE